jgi:hypothetical protein
MKIRALQRNLCCITCKRELEHVICSDKANAKYEDFPMWGDSIGPEFVLDQKSQMFFPSEYYKNKIQKLWVYKCKICPTVCRDVKSLRGHVAGEHNMHICLHCVENKQEFPAELKVYTQKQYETHLREGDQDGSQGHPNCEFCKKRYYDSTALFVHLNKDHYTCHLCEKAGIKFKYYKDYKHLEDHFRSAHMLCDDPVCLARKFIVFDNEIDMEVHNRKYHPTFTVKRATTIKLDFKVARPANKPTGNGAADEAVLKMDGSEAAEESNAQGYSGRYEGGLGGRERNGEWQVELQPISSDPRDINRNAHVTSAAPAPSSEAFVEEFPSLQSSGGSAPATGAITLTNKWVQLGGANGGGRKGKKNDFPALQTRKPPAAGSGLAGGKVQAGSTLSAIQKEYDSMGNESNQHSSANSRTVTGSLGDWARIKVDKKPAAVSKPVVSSQGRGGSGKDYTKTAYSNVNPSGADYEDSLAIALAESLSDAYRAAPAPAPVTPPAQATSVSPRPAPSVPAPSMDPADFPPPVPSSTSSGAALNQNAYPALAAPAAPPQPKPAKKPQNKSTAAGGWSEALSAVGLSGAAGTGKNAPKKKLTVIKASTSNSSLSKMGDEGGSVSPTIPPAASGAKAGSALPPGLSWDDFKPVAKKDEKADSEWRAASSAAPVSGVKSAPAVGSAPAPRPQVGSANASSAGGAKPHGGWAKIGGAGKEHGGDSQPAQAVPYKSSQDYPTLGSSSRTK